jgi:hypothetical protein
MPVVSTVRVMLRSYRRPVLFMPTVRGVICVWHRVLRIAVHYAFLGRTV